MVDPLQSQQVAQRAPLAIVERKLAERSLGEFIRQAWHILEPATVYRHGFHIDAIVEHLEAVSRGEIRRLLINIPPRCMKSLSVSVAWQVWEWLQEFYDADGEPVIVPGRGAYTRWLFASYAQALSVRDTLKARRIIQSQWYQERWGDRFHFAGDQNAKTRFENNKQGMRLATSVDAYATGEGGDIIVIDDPHNVREAESEAKREGALVWLDEVMSTRFNDQKTGRQVMVMQRVHDRDCSGHVLEQGGYVHLCLPMRHEPSRLVEWRHDGSPNEQYIPPTALGFVDPRTKEGDLLWEEHLDLEAVDKLELVLGPYGTAGQLQQWPTPRGGGMFKRGDIRFVDDVPEGVAMRFVRSWDLAATDPEKQTSLTDPDWTVGVLMGATMGADPDFYVCDVVRVREDPGPRDEIMLQTGREDKALIGTHPVWVEQEPGASGKSQIVHFRDEFRKIGLSVNPARVEVMPQTPGAKKRIKEAATAQGNKVQRAEPLATQSTRGKLYVLRKAWTKTYTDELTKFPMGSHDDQVDGTSQAHMRLTESKVSTAQAMKQKGYFR